MAELRPYQKEAIEAVRTAAQKGHRRILLSMSTGSGKSLCVASMAQKAPGRVLVLCHQAEILKQNQKAFAEVSGGEASGIFCAGLGEKDLTKRVTFAHRDSLGNHLGNIGEWPLVIADECHLISSRTVSRYSQILEETNFRHLIGLTATPYRSSGGRIYGKGKTFDVCAYTVNIQTLIKQGYLSQYVVNIHTTLDTTGVAERGNDFDEASLSAKALQEKSLNDSAMAILQKTTDRKCTLIFCVGRKHAQEIAARLPACEYIDGETKQADRDTLLARMRAGQVKYCVNVGVLTTGTDIPCIDCVAMLRPTMSTSLYVQMVGRGLRKHPDKKNLLVLELTDNFERFGSLDDPMLFGSATEHEITETIGDTPPPLKACPECDFEVPNGTRECPHCGYLFIRARADYGNGEIVSLDVISSHHAPCRTKNGDDAIVVTFVTQVGVIKEWLNINHSNPWVAQTSQAKLRKLRQMPVEVIKVRGLNETYPRILSYHIDV